jgi:hypothetical protein
MTCETMGSTLYLRRRELIELTEIGEQVNPTSAVTSCTTIPSKARIFAAEGSLAFWTLLQHWIGPVLHWLAWGAGVAAARMAREETIASLENIVSYVEMVVELRAAGFD